jgi:[acyl-carrier-protein] S-malonyltransferase
MVSVFPLGHDELLPVVERAKERGPIAIANLNSPTQNVIAGSRAALDAACAELEDLGCACVEIESRIPMHTPMFEPVSKVLGPILRRVPWSTPHAPYLANVTARFEDARRIPELLELHVHSPVMWRASIDLVSKTVEEPVFVEVGPRSVLCNLLSRSWTKSPRHRTDSETLDAALEEIARAA